MNSTLLTEVLPGNVSFFQLNISQWNYVSIKYSSLKFQKIYTLERYIAMKYGGLSCI